MADEHGPTRKCERCSLAFEGSAGCQVRELSREDLASLGYELRCDWQLLSRLERLYGSAVREVLTTLHHCGAIRMRQPGVADVEFQWIK